MTKKDEARGFKIYSEYYPLTEAILSEEEDKRKNLPWFENISKTDYKLLIETWPCFFNVEMEILMRAFKSEKKMKTKYFKLNWDWSLSRSKGFCLYYDANESKKFYVYGWVKSEKVMQIEYTNENKNEKRLLAIPPDDNKYQWFAIYELDINNWEKSCKSAATHFEIL